MAGLEPAIPACQIASMPRLIWQHAERA